MPLISLQKLRSSKGNQQGFSLIELMVVLTILSILATMTVPSVKLYVQRQKEIELRQALRDMRTAIDQFHADWRAVKGQGSFAESASENGYPKTLTVLTDGVATAGVIAKTKRYLRRLPKNPFAKPDVPLEEHWTLLAVSDPPDASIWSGGDVFDIKANTDKTAIDGSAYHDW